MSSRMSLAIFSISRNSTDVKSPLPIVALLV
jgi:hypothetical protein